MKTRPPILTLGLAAVAFAIHLVPDAATGLQLDRGVPLLREPWRIWTSHFTHFDSNHLRWDVGVLLVLGAIGERISRVRCAVTVVFAAAAISLAVWVGQPQFQFYRGLSGIDCAMFGLFAGALLRQPSPGARIAGLAGLLGALLKCAVELTTGSTIFALGQSYAPVPLAHLVGLLAGACVAVARISTRQTPAHAGSPRADFS